DVVVFHLQAVVKPGAVAKQRAGKGEAGNKLVEAQAIDLVKRRNKVCRIEAKFVVAHPRKERDDTAGGAAILHREAGEFDLNGADRVRADAHGQVAVDGRADIKTVKQVERFPSLRPGDMDLLAGALDHTRIERQQIANVARGWIRNVDDLRGIHDLRIGDLVRIDSRRRRSDIDLFPDDLLVSDNHVQSGKIGIDGAFGSLIEAG